MKALITGALGDILDVTKWFTDEERKVETILWASPQQGPTAESLVERLFPTVKQHVRIWPEWLPRKGLYLNAKALSVALEKEGRTLPDCLDWSVETIFSDRSRSWNRHELFTPVPGGDYWAVQAFSSHEPGWWRDFNEEEWSTLIAWLERMDQRAMILGTGDQFVPDHPRIENRVNRTSLLEAVDLARAAKGAISVDSFFASLTAPIFDQRRLAIRIRAVWPEFYLRARYGPHTTWPFVGSNLKALLDRLDT